MYKAKQGFTLIELLLVIAIISILVGITTVFLNPTKQLGNSRNTDRRADINTLLNAVYQYSIDNNGSLPTLAPAISTTPTPVCSTTGSVCASAGFVDFGQLIASEKYLASIPIDPSKPLAPSTGYTISKSVNGRITISATLAENGTVISVTR